MPKVKRNRVEIQKAFNETQRLARYKRAIEEVFLRHYQEDAQRLAFEKDELEEIGRKHGIPSTHVPDIVYTYRS